MLETEEPEPALVGRPPCKVVRLRRQTAPDGPPRRALHSATDERPAWNRLDHCYYYAAGTVRQAKPVPFGDALKAVLAGPHAEALAPKQ